jgi:DNA polymerase eta
LPKSKLKQHDVDFDCKLIKTNGDGIFLLISLKAGIGSNKVIAKLACKLHKPEGVTLLTRGGLLRVSKRIDFRDIRGLGGDLGEQLEDYFGHTLTMAQLRRESAKNSFHFNNFVTSFGIDDANEINRLAHGICFEPVERRLMNAKLNCGKNNVSKQF